jgi:hypothetical protein
LVDELDFAGNRWFDHDAAAVPDHAHDLEPFDRGVFIDRKPPVRRITRLSANKTQNNHLTTQPFDCAPVSGHLLPGGVPLPSALSADAAADTDV